MELYTAHIGSGGGGVLITYSYGYIREYVLVLVLLYMVIINLILCRSHTMFAVSNRKANRLLKTKRKRLKCDVKRVVSANRNSGAGDRGGGGRNVSNGFMTTTTVVHQNTNNNNNNKADVGGGADQLPPPPPPPPPLPLPTSLLPPLMSDANDDDNDDMKLIISPTASVKDNGLYENDTKLLKLIFPTCYQLETFMFLYDFFTLVGEDEKDNHQHNGDVAATNNTNSTTAAEAAAMASSSSSFGTQQSHFQYLLNNSTTKAQTSKLLNDEDIQSMIVNVSLDQDDFKRKLCSFPNLRIVHENISTCPLAMSECTVNYTVLVLEVKIYSLYRQFILSERNKSINSSTSASASGTTTSRSNHQYCARVIPDKDVFMEMKEMWKSYVFTEKYRPHGRRGSDTLTYSNVDTAVWSQYGDKNNTYLAFLQRNGLMSPSGEPVLPTLPSLSSSIFVNYCSFKIEEIQKGTCVNRLKKRIQLEVGPHTLIKYVSIFAEMYKAFITNVKDANKIISDYESVKHKSMKMMMMNTNDTTASTSTVPAASSILPPPSAPPVRRGRKRKNTEDIIGQYKSLTHKKTKYQSSAAAAAAAAATTPSSPQPIVAPDLTTLADVAVYSQTTQDVLNDTELQEILNNLFSPCSSTDTTNTSTTTGDIGISYQDKPPPVVILNPSSPTPTSPMKYAYVKDITRCMEDSSNFEESKTSTPDDDDDDDDDEDVNDDDDDNI